MSYQVIARKWRPQNFSSLIGQSHISSTLKNALQSDRLPHAMLFTGPRGTGKTSSARILAKSLRCENAVDFVPCEKCSECDEIAHSRSVNVIEIDGASNNGVDSVRELRDTVNYMPTSGKYKVYIIDEVHMLSTAAFNALLKTLEEPPAHVVFIMATTEIQKIPATILSRCQRFDFRRIPTRLVVERLQYICQQESVEVSTDALWVLARQADGSMRDSQTLLDQAITFIKGKLTNEKIVEVLGLTDRTMLLDALAVLLERNQGRLIGILKRVRDSGCDPGVFITDLLQNLRHLLLVKAMVDVSGNSTGISIEPVDGVSITDLVEASDSEIMFLRDLSLQCSQEDIQFLFDMALKGASDVNRSIDPDIVLEVLLMRMVNAPLVSDLSLLISNQGKQNHSRPANVISPSAPSSSVSSANPSSASAHATVSNDRHQDRSQAQKPSPQNASPQKSTSHNTSPQKSPLEQWVTFVEKMKSIDALVSAKIEHLQFVSINGKQVVLTVPGKMAFLIDQMKDLQFQKKMQTCIDQTWGSGYSINIRLGGGSAEGTSVVAVISAQEEQKQKEIMESIVANPKIKATMESFKAPIKSVTDLGTSQITKGESK